MILKELESSNLSSFSVNLTDIFKITAKYRRNVSPSRDLETLRLFDV